MRSSRLAISAFSGGHAKSCSKGVPTGVWSWPRTAPKSSGSTARARWSCIAGAARCSTTSNWRSTSTTIFRFREAGCGRALYRSGRGRSRRRSSRGLTRARQNGANQCNRSVKGSALRADPERHRLVRQFGKHEIEVNFDATFPLWSDRSGGELMIRDHFYGKLMLNGFAGEQQDDSKRPGTGWQQHMRTLQQTTRSAGDVDGARCSFLRPVTEKKQIGGPADRAQLAGRELAQIRPESALHQVA